MPAASYGQPLGCGRVSGPDRPELIGYVDPFVAHAGEPVELMVSTTEATWDYRVVRLLHGDRNPAGPGFKVAEVQPRIAGTRRSRAGCRPRMPARSRRRRRCRAWRPPKRVQLRLWAQPTLVGDGRRQVLLSSHDDAGGPGFELALTGEGCFELDARRRDPRRAGRAGPCRGLVPAHRRDGRPGGHGGPRAPPGARPPRCGPARRGGARGGPGRRPGRRLRRPARDGGERGRPASRARSASASTTTASSRHRRSSRPARPGKRCAASRAGTSGTASPAIACPTAGRARATRAW